MAFIVWIVGSILAFCWVMHNALQDRAATWPVPPLIAVPMFVVISIGWPLWAFFALLMLLNDLVDFLSRESNS